MTERNTIQRAMDLALRIGDLLLANGAGAADVAATMTAVTHHLKVRRALVDVTFTSLTLSYQSSVEDAPLVMRRHVTVRETDFADLAAVDEVVSQLLSDELTMDEAATEVARIASTGHPHPRWSITLGWMVTGSGIAFILTSSWIVILLAGLSGGALEVLQRRIGRWRLPSFYTQAVGGIFATLVAVGVAATRLPVSPTEVVSASIVLLLAGLGFVGAIQDGLTGYYITANARILEVILSTAGLLTGVSVGLSIGSALGVTVFVEPGRSGFAALPLATLGAAITAAGFAFTSYAPKRAILPTGIVGALAMAGYYSLLQNGLGRPTAAAIAAIIIGVVSFPVARIFRVPPLVPIVSGIVPLLPGLTILRGLSELGQNDFTGLLTMVTAAAVALALAAGAILGEYVAQPIQREARRLEERLVGPRLVGPLRIRRRS